MPNLRKVAATTEAPVAIEARMDNPAALIPESWQGIQQLLVAIQKGGLPASTLELVHMRASQINGCSVCVDGAIREGHRSGELDDRLLMVAAWQHSSRFSAAERAALEPAEEMTRLADRPDPVPDGTWARAVEHYDHRARRARFRRL